MANQQAENMFSGITPENIASFWEDNPVQTTPFIGQTLFADDKQAGSQVEWYKGANSAPTPLAPASFNTSANMRDRQGFEKVTTETHYYKEGFYIDEQTRQELLNLQSGVDSTRRDFVNSRIFNDANRLIAGANLTTELARVQLLKTGKYSFTGNGATYNEDYLTADQRSNGYNRNDSTTAISDGRSNPAKLFQQAQDAVAQNTGNNLTRMIMNTNTFRALLTNNQIKSTLLANNGNTSAVAIPQAELRSYFSDEFGLTIQTYDKVYSVWNAATQSWVPARFWGDGEITMLPDGQVGRTVYSITPEEADLMGVSDVQVAMVGNVAVSTSFTNDPVNKKIIASQQFTPTFEQIDSVYNITVPLGSNNGSTTAQTTANTTATTDSKSDK